MRPTPGKASSIKAANPTWAFMTASCPKAKIVTIDAMKIGTNINRSCTRPKDPDDMAVMVRLLVLLLVLMLLILFLLLPLLALTPNVSVSACHSKFSRGKGGRGTPKKGSEQAPQAAE